MYRKIAWFLPLPFFLAAPLWSFPQLEDLRSRLAADGAGEVAAVASPNCTGGVVVDDGTFENGYASSAGPAVRFLMRIDSAPGTLEQVCVCLTRTGSDNNLAGSILVYDNDGANGTPGSLLGSGAAVAATGIPLFPLSRFYEIDMTPLNIRTDGSVYLGLSTIPALEDGVFLCADETGPVKSPGFVRADSSPSDDVPWVPLGGPQVFPDYSALGLRADIIEDQGACQEDATTMCLNDGRFRVTVDWQRRNGANGQGQAVRLTGDTGYFWFFNAANVEMVIKVLDACTAPAPRFWVFAGGLTNVEVDIRVEDTESGEVRTYSNPQGTPFQPIQDTDAFATCP